MTILGPTEQQRLAIQAQTNMVVVAVPGSGKTYVLSEKIRAILPNLPHYKGVVAISYTNKASAELEKRSLRDGLLKGSSFFGTIDSFYLTEIIIPFGRHVFGEPKTDPLVETLDGVGAENSVREAVAAADDGIINDSLIVAMKKYYSEGKVLLEAIGSLASHIFDNSLACRRYLKARYSHVFIDEYQDCGYWQHRLFMGMVNLGMTGVVVGDVNQSIFAFAKRDSRYLVELMQHDQTFTMFSLTRNHRSHQSITNYATRLLSNSVILPRTEEIRVFERRVEGSEIAIAEWLTSAVPLLAQKYDVQRNQIAVLVKNKRTSDLVHRYIGIPHKQVISTPLDQDSSLWGSVFRRLLTWIFDSAQTKYEVVESYLNADFQQAAVLKMMSMLRQLEQIAAADRADLQKYTGAFAEIAELVFPGATNSSALANLVKTLTDQNLLDSYLPPATNEIQIMTMHRSKGLEFDIVFHLDLYKHILPIWNGDETQELNLHYVGITRARHVCILCTSTDRHNYEYRLVSAADSEFLARNGLSSLRVSCPV